jgi:fructose-1,6-bisphosphatase/inositol monophosphatase family enzyme
MSEHTPCHGETRRQDSAEALCHRSGDYDRIGDGRRLVLVADRIVTIDRQLSRRVTDIIEQVIADVVMPSFRALRPEDIEAKDTPGDPEDVVTIADTSAERLLVERLSGLVPGAAFIGEEGTAANPALLSALSSPAPVWLIDPIDGTKNFAHGSVNFGVMLALVEAGVTRASWMAVPAVQPAGFGVSAIRGGGTRIDGTPVVLSRPAAHPACGTIHTRMMPAEKARRVLDAVAGKYDLQASTGSAATEYSAILRGDKDFVVYYRLLPWDHAPGALAVVEAGGVGVHLNGEPYTPLSPNQVTIFAASAGLAAELRGRLTGG